MIGDRIGADRALDYGLLESVHPVSDRPEATAVLAMKLTHRPLFTFAQLKASLNTAIDADVASALDAES
ncbi:hypothetical protein [Bradyrhizobium betae]|uniref:Uncharacterized protein n=1 Tax=Bradyrhizobium betae TaxID=244734 RepID=A0A4Q1VRU0_9BRAD|nr:hypothetical protein [Bradyrhizobium betae]RXT54266.1 hypothetical protein B5V03_02165 [Bradyrhizobium betae]